MKDGKLAANEARRQIQHESSSRRVNLVKLSLSVRRSGKADGSLKSVNLSGGKPAVALTDYAKAEDHVRAFRAGFWIHVPKPVKPAKLGPDMANHVGRSVRT